MTSTSRRAHAALLGAALVAPLALAGGLTAPASAKGGPTGGTGAWYYFNDAFSGTANRALQFGETGDVVHVADTDGTGGDSLMIRRGNQFLARTSLTSGPADVVFTYGDRGDTVLVGDWDGNGNDTLAVRRGNQFFVKNSVTSGPADVVFTYGDRGDTVLVGDWDGAGGDTLGVRRGNVYFLKNSTTSGVADVVVGYGENTDTVLVGDWNGDGTDTLGVRRTLPAAIPPVTPPAPFVVGRDVSPGLYRATGPFSGDGCAYLVETPGQPDWEGYMPSGQAYIELTVGQTFYALADCGTWEYRRTGPVQATLGDGEWIVGQDIAPGTYRAAGSDCFAAETTSFEVETTVTAEYGPGDTANLAAGDLLYSSGCTWTLLP